MGSALLTGSDVAFGVVFGVFVFALLVLAVVAIRWGVRHDRPGREAWKRRHLDGGGLRVEPTSKSTRIPDRKGQ